MYVIRIYPSMSNKVLEGLSEFNAVLALLEAFRTRGAHAESIMASAQLVSKCCLPGSPRVSQGLPGVLFVFQVFQVFFLCGRSG